MATPSPALGEANSQPGVWLLLILFSPLVIKLLPSYNVKGDRHLGPKMGGNPGKQPQPFWGYPDLRNGIKAQGPSTAMDTTLWVTCSSEVSFPLASSGQDSGTGTPGTRDTSNWQQGSGCGCGSRPSGAQLHQLWSRFLNGACPPSLG